MLREKSHISDGGIDEMCHSEEDPQEHLCQHPLCVHSRQMGLSESQSLLVTEGPVILETEECECFVGPLWTSCCVMFLQSAWDSYCFHVHRQRNIGSKKLSVLGKGPIAGRMQPWLET